MQIHAFFLALFSSLIAPFGGFFASGFKRAFKVKVTIWRLLMDSCFFFNNLHVRAVLLFSLHRKICRKTVNGTITRQRFIKFWFLSGHVHEYKHFYLVSCRTLVTPFLVMVA